MQLAIKNHRHGLKVSEKSFFKHFDHLFVFQGFSKYTDAREYQGELVFLQIISQHNLFKLYLNNAFFLKHKNFSLCRLVKATNVPDHPPISTRTSGVRCSHTSTVEIRVETV